MTQQPQRLTWALTSRHFRKNHRACNTAEEWECGPREWMTPWICNKEFTCLTRLYGNALYIWLTTQSRSIHLYYTLFFFMEDAPLLLQMSYRFNENCTVAHNGSFSARLNVSLCWNFPFLSPPLCPYCDTVVLQSSLFLKNKVEKISIKGGVFLCGLQESLASGFHLKHKGVFLPDLYSFTQWVDLPLLFPSKESPDETFVHPIIGYVRVASSSTSLGVQPQALSWMDFFPSSLLLCVCFKKPFQINVSAVFFFLCAFVFGSCVISIKPNLRISLSVSRTHKLAV